MNPNVSIIESKKIRPATPLHSDAHPGGFFILYNSGYAI